MRGNIPYSRWSFQHQLNCLINNYNVIPLSITCPSLQLYSPLYVHAMSWEQWSTQNGCGDYGRLYQITADAGGLQKRTELSSLPLADLCRFSHERDLCSRFCTAGNKNVIMKDRQFSRQSNVWKTNNSAESAIWKTNNSAEKSMYERPTTQQRGEFERPIIQQRNQCMKDQQLSREGNLKNQQFSRGQFDRPIK